MTVAQRSLIRPESYEDFLRQSRIFVAEWGGAGGSWQAGSTMLHPFAEVGYNHDGRADDRYVSAGLNSMAGRFDVQGFTPDKTWATADLGVTADFSQTWSGWASYSGRFAQKRSVTHVLRTRVRLDKPAGGEVHTAQNGNRSAPCSASGNP